MRNDIVCPKCNSADVIFSKKRQVYICEEEGCRHEFLPDKERSHLRIFISYGRDEYAALAERLKADLSRRGHEVWFDSERLKEGGDWERYIEEGINHVARDISTGRVVFIMTPHSNRRPDGYCPGSSAPFHNERLSEKHTLTFKESKHGIGQDFPGEISQGIRLLHLSRHERGERGAG